jgi:glycosyltransferase involved in cell wall biosynthesis
MLKLLKLVTTFQSVVTILSPKLSDLASRSEMELHVASSFEDSAERRRSAGIFHEVFISRTINPISDFLAIIKLSRLIKKHRFDIVHTHTAKAGTVGAMAAALAGVPVVHTYHGLPFFEGQRGIAFRLYRAVELFLSGYRKAVFSQNKRDYEQLKSMRGLRCPVYYEGNGVSIKQIEKSAQEREGDVASMFPDRGRAHILCVARLEPVKHLGTVLNAMVFLKEKNVSADCIIAGKGPLKEQLERQIESMGLAEKVKIIYTPYIHALINKADIAILTSAKEGIPRGLMEAMALAKPVVATNVLGTNELVVNGETGILVPFGDQNAFNDVLLTVINDADLRERFGKAGRMRVEKEFSDSRAVDLWIEKYREILGKSPKAKMQNP